MRRKAVSKVQNKVTNEAEITSDEKNAVLHKNENQITGEQSAVTALVKHGRKKGAVEDTKVVLRAPKHGRKNVAEYLDDEKAYESDDIDEKVAYDRKFEKDDENIEQDESRKVVGYETAEKIILLVKHGRKQAAIENTVGDKIGPVAKRGRKSAVLQLAANTSKDVKSPNVLKTVTDSKDFQLSSHIAINQKGDATQMQEDSFEDNRSEDVGKLAENKNKETKKNQPIINICLDEDSSYKDNTETKQFAKRDKKRKNKSEDVDGQVVKQNISFSANYGSNVVMKEVKIILNRKDAEYEKCYENSEASKDSERKEKVVPSQSSRATKRNIERSSSELEGKPAKVLKKSKSSKQKIPDVTALEFSSESKTSSGKLWNFKISSWNINGVRAWLEKDGLSYFLHEKPDILCIQETKCSDAKLPDEVKSIDGYHTYWLSGDKDGYSGVGLITKEKPIKVEFGIGVPEHDNEGRIITAEYEKFYLVAGYVPNAGRGLVRLNYRMQWDKNFRSYLRKLDEEKAVILCGDLNVAHLEIDLANPKTNKKNAGFTKEERDGFSTLLKENNFLDTFRHLYPDTEGAYTFWTYMMNSRAKNVGWRLDYFVISKRFEENLCDSVIRKDVFGSDHCPIALFLSL